jgi:LacI family transcriptional regulator, galactose operon repressor
MPRKTTLQDIAAAAGVSIATVDRVINARGGVAPELEARVLECARRLHVDRDLNRRPTRLVRIGVVLSPPSNPFFEGMARAFAKANQRFAHENVQSQLFHVDVLRPRDVAATIRKVGASHDALIVICPDSVEVSAALQAISTAKPVVTLVTDLPHSGRMAYVGLDNRKAGRVAGELMGRFLGSSGGEVLVIAGLHSFIGHGEREMGFRAVLGERFPNCRVASVIETREQRDRAGELLRAVLLKYPDVAGIYNISVGNRGIARTLREVGRAEHTVLITHELTEGRRELLREGVIDAIIDQDPETEAMVAVGAIAHRFGRHPVAEPNITPFNIYIRENC